MIDHMSFFWTQTFGRTYARTQNPLGAESETLGSFLVPNFGVIFGSKNLRTLVLHTMRANII